MWFKFLSFNIFLHGLGFILYGDLFFINSLHISLFLRSYYAHEQVIYSVKIPLVILCALVLAHNFGEKKQ